MQIAQNKKKMLKIEAITKSNRIQFFTSQAGTHLQI